MSAESAFITALRALAGHPGARGLDDDCAILEVGSEMLVITHDSIAEGLHFLPEQDAADLAWKLVATNLSDLAAKGAKPLGVLLGYQLGKDDAGFAAGLGEALAHYDVPLLGGDTIGATGPRVLGMTALGRATHCPVPARSGARPGHGLWITGPLGAAMAGLDAIRSGTGDGLAYRRPRALLEEGYALAPMVSAMMDLSDGLLLDASRLAAASRVTLSIDSSSVPIVSEALARRDDALRWGDDYQLLFALPDGLEPAVPSHRIGTALPPGPSPLLIDGIAPRGRLGFEHQA